LPCRRNQRTDAGANAGTNPADEQCSGRVAGICEIFAAPLVSGGEIAGLRADDCADTKSNDRP
jgi:hypothetical protein